MASVEMLVGGALVNALAFSGSNWLFSMLRSSGLDEERSVTIKQSNSYRPRRQNGLENGLSVSIGIVKTSAVRGTPSRPFGMSTTREERKIKGALADPKAMRMTREGWLAFRTAETCHLCDIPLEGDSVRDHCHITGEYRRAAHNACNLKLRLNPSIPAVFHNLRGYKSHLLMQAISKVEGRVSCIPNNTGKVYLLFRTAALY